MAVGWVLLGPPFCVVDGAGRWGRLRLKMSSLNLELENPGGVVIGCMAQQDLLSPLFFVKLGASGSRDNIIKPHHNTIEDQFDNQRIPVQSAT